MKHTLKFAALALAVSLAACGDSSTTSTTTTDSNMDTQPIGAASADQVPVGSDAGMNSAMTDQDFVTRASSMNVAEINAHQAAKSHATTSDVKMHAKHMLTDHQKMGDEMKALASKKNLTVSPTILLPKKSRCWMI